MYKGTPEFPRTPDFMRYAASSCGMPVELHGKQEVMGPGAELTLELPQPFATSAFCRANIPPIVVKVASFCVISEYQVGRDVQRINSAGREIEDPRPVSEVRIFEGQTVRSLHQAVKEGDTVIGLAATDCAVLLLNADDPETMGHLLGTYGKRYMKHVSA